MKTPTRSLAISLALALGLAACSETPAEEAVATNDSSAELAAAIADLEAAQERIENLEDELDEAGEPAALAMVEETESGHTEGDDDGHWSYSGVTGPANWAALNQQFALCESGVEQSPIDIPMMGTFPVGLDNLELDWAPSTLTMVNNGHTIQANVLPGNTTMIDNVPYTMLQFHFHKPSEHTVQGEAFPMELHFVHADAAGNLAVIGVLLAEGIEAHPAYDILWRNQPVVGDQLIIEDFDLTSLLPDDLTRWRYNGSLTTPPCSEGVNWNVLAMPTFMSRAQIASFLYDGNARPTLPLNERDVLRDQS